MAIQRWVCRWRRGCLLAIASALTVAACSGAPGAARAGWEADNPLKPIPRVPLGAAINLLALKTPPTPERVRLGRWLFFDRRLSADNTLSCASCHQPEHGFSQRTSTAVGIGGRRGRRKVPPLINLAVFRPPTAFQTGPEAAYFWDGRATSLERQVIGPIANADEMGSTAEGMIRTLERVSAYRPYFVQAFGDRRITNERVAHAIADYERTRLSGNSPVDRWKLGHEENAVTDAVKRGYALFAGKAECGHCHLAAGFAGGAFHNIGIGWDADRKAFADDGRHAVTKGSVFETWPGTFKAPTLRDVSRHPPYMHDGSIPTLRAVVEYYNRGANPNPYLSAFIHPLGLSTTEIDDIVAFLNALDGDGWQDDGPSQFPR